MSPKRESVRSLGEFALIDRLAARVPPLSPDVVLGIGDDVAAVEIAPGRLLLITCDVQVGGSHFLLDRCDPLRLGRKAAAINISDIAACGGSPSHFLSSLVIPGDTEVEFLDRLYQGLSAEAVRWGADVIGGNVSRGDSLVIDLTLLGRIAASDLLRRDGAGVGDLVLVTGRLGAAAAGLHLVLQPETRVDGQSRTAAIEAYETPTPRLAEAQALVGAGGVSAAIDVSDGLAADLGHVCAASGVGARIDAREIPVAAAAQAVARSASRDALEWALGGGEDYELLFTAPAERVEDLQQAVACATGTPTTVIGEIVPRSAGLTRIAPDGSSRPLSAAGWRHF